ncbi:MAG TPA: hypothetical protein VG711_08785, partial [Phycisphaerales bacterium]|nr:hypothetical protein [Phycisphaerales bacterium]
WHETIDCACDESPAHRRVRYFTIERPAMLIGRGSERLWTRLTIHQGVEMRRAHAACLTGLVASAIGIFADQALGRPVPPPASGPPMQQHAQPQGETGRLQVPMHPFVANIPGATEVETPEWIVPGTRIAYLCGMGTVNDAAGAFKMVEDPNGPFVDSNGKHFRQGDTVGTPTGNSWYSFADVIAAEPGVVVIANIGYHLGFNGVGSQTPLSMQTAFSHPSGCDFFLHPKLLEQIHGPTSNGVEVMRYNMHHDNGNNYEVVHFVTANSADHRQSQAYDLASGVQLTFTSQVKSTNEAAFKQVGDQFSQTPNASQSLSIMRFISARTLEFPWRNETPPDWAKTMKKARFEGATTFAGPAYTNLPNWSIRQSIDFTTKYVGKTFITYDMSVTQQAPNQQAQTTPSQLAACGPGSIGGLWINPDVLKTLKQGTKFDTDPTTGVKVGVDYVGQDNAGRPVVVIAMGNQVFKSSYIYSAADGKMIGLSRQDVDPTNNVKTLQLQLVGME